LREEAEGRRVAEDRARTLEARLNEVAAHLQQNQQKGKPDFFANPDESVRALVQQVLAPYAEQQNRAAMANSQMLARYVHGAEKVDGAEAAFLKAMNAKTLDPMEYEQVVQSPNRYDAVVQWHRRHQTFTQVGDDPAAWFEKQLEAKLADPAFQAALIEKVRGGTSAKPGVVKIPPSLSKSSGSNGSGAELGDMSDSSLFANAMRK
jgi:hypothetical protein